VVACLAAGNLAGVLVVVASSAEAAFEMVLVAEAAAQQTADLHPEEVLQPHTLHKISGPQLIELHN